MYAHKPVLLREVMSCLDPEPDSVVVDATLGEGGHAAALLQKLESGMLIGIEQDEEVMARARERLSGFNGRFLPVRDNFANMKQIVRAGSPTGRADRILFDLGISMFHLTESGRGFSFSRDEELDMRLDKNRPLNALRVVNEFDRRKLSEIIWAYGEERFAGRIANRIVQERKTSRIHTSLELADIVSKAIPRKYWPKRIHPATRTFQAIRVFVNDEIDLLEQAVRDAVSVLEPEGTICIISFHSLEDRIVKSVFNDFRKGCTCPPDFPVCVCGGRKTLCVLTRKPVTAGEDEIERNPASRSARMRCARKLQEPGSGSINEEIQQSA